MKPYYPVVAHIKIDATQVKHWFPRGTSSKYHHPFPGKLHVFRILAVFIAALLIPHVSDATSIVVVWTENSVFIGADSLQIDGAFIPKTGQVCKILQIGDLFVATAFLFSDKRTGLDMNKLFETAYVKGDPMVKTVEIFESIAFVSLNKQIAFFAHSKDKDDIAEMARLRTQPLVEIAVVGTEDGKPSFYSIRFDADALDTEAPHIKIANSTHCPGADCTPYTVVLMGMRYAIGEYISGNKNWWKDLGPIGSIRKFISLEITALPQYVGGPIDILEVNSKGHYWVQGEKQCCQTSEPANK